MAERKAVLVRLDPALHAALQRWAADELRSFNAQVEYLLAEALRASGRAGNRARPRSDPAPPPTGD